MSNWGTISDGLASRLDMQSLLLVSTVVELVSDNINRPTRLPLNGQQIVVQVHVHVRVALPERFGR
jgi:hypothetical protein